MNIFDHRILEAFYCVRADDFACDTLQRHYGKENDWHSASTGVWMVIGEFHDLPVNLSFKFATVLGVPILFYDCMSLLAHWGMIEEWMEQNVPAMGKLPSNGERRHCDAMNFHNCLWDIQRFNAERKKSKGSV
jgi:hypothetical protein